jgi:hypothetical protein
MDGGLTFFPHPDLWLEAGPEARVGPAGVGMDTSTRVGGAATTAVAEMVVGGALITPT